MLLPVSLRMRNGQGGIMSGALQVPSGIFVSYRREDSAYPAGWLFDRLAEHFGRARVFKDDDSIDPGENFAEVIATAVSSCAALVAVIGGLWLTAADEDGRRRLDDPEDFVRVEIETALARGVRVFPVLVNGASMPRSADLPRCPHLPATHDGPPYPDTPLVTRPLVTERVQRTTTDARSGRGCAVPGGWPSIGKRSGWIPATPATTTPSPASFTMRGNWPRLRPSTGKQSAWSPETVATVTPWVCC